MERAFQALALLVSADLARDANVFDGRHIDDVAAWQGDVRGDARAFLADGFFGNLDDDLLSQLRCGDLLPGWYDDWVLYERSRLAQLRLRALESLAEQLVSLGDTRGALEAALAAVAIEPLRESAERALIRVHIADGNYLDAVREYRSFRTRLAAEMDVSPSGQLESLIHPLLVSRARIRTSTATA